jgi:hypothetical protein
MRRLNAEAHLEPPTTKQLLLELRASDNADAGLVSLVTVRSSSSASGGPSANANPFNSTVEELLLRGEVNAAALRHVHQFEEAFDRKMAREEQADLRRRAKKARQQERQQLLLFPSLLFGPRSRTQGVVVCTGAACVAFFVVNALVGARRRPEPATE